MRTIKFRAWNGKKMIAEPRVIEGDLNEKLQGWQGNYKDNGQHQLMQFTGLTDKNGVEIYEGDIVKSVEEFNAYTGMESEIYGGQTYSVEYKGKGFVLVPEPITNHSVRWSKCEVIGNVWENPELLEEE